LNARFQPPPKSLTPRDYQFLVLVTLAFLALCAALVFANLSLKGGGDFYAHWVGARAFLFEKIDPYGAETPARVQPLIGAPSDSEPYILVTPFQVIPFYYPLSFLPDPKLARALFTLLLELALFALAVLSLLLTGWQAPRIFAILFVLFTVFNFYTFQAISEASPVLILALLYVGILFAYRAELDELAGALAALAFSSWEVGALFLLLVFWRAHHEKRKGVFSGFFMLSFILFFISFLSYPNWLIPFLRANANNLRADFGFNIRAILLDFFPAQGNALGWILTLGLILALGYEWNAARSGEFRRFYWTACLSLAAAPLLGFRTEMENLAVLVIPLALIFAIIHDRWQKFKDSLTLLLMSALFLIPWLFYFFRLPQDLLFLFLPFFTFIGLYWIRWWAIRPPRIFSDFANPK
jgi:hypothetical protein